MVSSSLKSESFTFTRRSGESQRCRRRLEGKFDEAEGGARGSSPEGDRTVMSMLSFNHTTRKALRNGAQRFTRTFNSVCTTIGTLTQRFRTSTKRRQILEEGPMTPSCATPYTRQILGRTPTKLYSPFGIESPYNKPTTYDKGTTPSEA